MNISLGPWGINVLKRLKAALYAQADDSAGSSQGAVWRNLLESEDAAWSAAKATAAGPRVLMATSMGGYDNGTALESTLSVALTLRGARVEILLCDEFLPACQLTKLSKLQGRPLTDAAQREICRPCFSSGRDVYDPLGLPVHRYSTHVTRAQRQQAKRLAAAVPLDEVASWRWEGLAVGEHAMAGALRFYGRGDLQAEPDAEVVLRRYVEAALLTTFAVQGLLAANDYDVAVFHHGIYVPQGLIGEVCRQRGVRVVNSNPAYRSQTFIFSHGDSYHHTMISEPVGLWQSMRWDAELEEQTLGYLNSRRRGEGDWIYFNEHPEEQLSAISAETGLTFERPTVALLTNVMWDAQLHYSSNAFANMLDWVNHTIEVFAKRPELDLVIRVHPAEVTGAVPSRQPLVPEIHRAFPNLPSNVYVVPPESKISTYQLLDQCDSALIFNTKTGIELASAGIPVVVAGEAWIRGKGFSLDATSVADYDAILATLPVQRKLPPAQLALARRYAHHFFFRRMIPISVITSPERFRFLIDVTDLAVLAPGGDRGIETVCDGILDGTPFVYEAS